MNKLVLLFTVTMFLAVFSLIGCNKPQEPAKPEATQEQDPAATPAQEPAGTAAQEPAAAAKPLPKVGNVLFTVIDVFEKKPIREAIVNVTLNQKIRAIKTDKAGKALFKDLPFGGHTFTVSSPINSLVPDVVNTNVTVPRGKTAARTITLRIRQ